MSYYVMSSYHVITIDDDDILYCKSKVMDVAVCHV